MSNKRKEKRNEDPFFRAAVVCPFGVWFASAMPGNAQLSSPQPPAKFVEITENGSEVEVSGVAGRFYQPQCSLDLV